MINADQARQQARNSVFEQIEARAKEGYYSLCLKIPTESFKEAFFRELAEKHGFSVSVESSAFKFIIYISWLIKVNTKITKKGKIIFTNLDKV